VIFIAILIKRQFKIEEPLLDFVLHTCTSLRLKCSAPRGRSIWKHNYCDDGSSCQLLAVTIKNLVQDQTGSVINGYQWSFGTTILVTLLATLLKEAG